MAENNGKITTVSDVPWLVRREIEALMIAPFLEAFSAEFGREKTLEIAGKVIDRLAAESGRAYAEEMDLKKDETLSPAIREQLLSHNIAGDCDNRLVEETEDHVTVHTCDCDYVKMYERIGLKDLGCLLSCRRDVGFYEGMGLGLRLVREGTRMEGCDVCDFRVEKE